MLHFYAVIESFVIWRENGGVQKLNEKCIICELESHLPIFL